MAEELKLSKERHVPATISPEEWKAIEVALTSSRQTKTLASQEHLLRGILQLKERGNVPSTADELWATKNEALNVVGNQASDKFDDVAKRKKLPFRLRTIEKHRVRGLRKVALVRVEVK